uniref:Uncharacterized protein n=1 Tax=Tanacetum cinerariifolium TaxID=118510 RepID=A0A6L2J095_TANCI|nr:hypothetical protein [Tanacetum cinerariifolium]
MLPEVSCFKVHSDFQTSLSPNDDGRVYNIPHNDGNAHPCSSNADDYEDDFVTSMGETSSSEGNVHINSDSTAQWNFLENLSKAVVSKWLWKIKYKSTSEIERYKARVVAKGFSQREEFDYLEILITLSKCPLLASKHVDTPLPINATLNYTESDDDHLLMNVLNHQRLVDHASLFPTNGSFSAIAMKALNFVVPSSSEDIDLSSQPNDLATNPLSLFLLSPFPLSYFPLVSSSILRDKTAISAFSPLYFPLESFHCQLMLCTQRVLSLPADALHTAGLSSPPSLTLRAHGLFVKKRTNRPKSTLGHLAWADAFVITADSVSMLSEACCTGKPVYVIGAERCTWNFAYFHKCLQERGMVRPFTGRENMTETWIYPPLQDTMEAADI